MAVVRLLKEAYAKYGLGHKDEKLVDKGRRKMRSLFSMPWSKKTNKRNTHRQHSGAQGDITDRKSRASKGRTSKSMIV